MNNYPPTWTSRPKRRNWKGWLLALASSQPFQLLVPLDSNLP